MRSIRVLLSVLAVALLGTGHAAAEQRATEASVDTAVAQAPRADRLRVIVRYRPGSESRLRDRLINHGARVSQRHGLIGALSVQLHAADIAELRRDPDVLGISSDALVRASQFELAVATSPSDATITSIADIPDSTALDPIAVTAPTSLLSVESTVTAEYDVQGLRRTLGLTRNDTGNGVGVAIIDSGIAPVADVQSQVTAFYDFTSGRGAVATDLSDGYGHGTHVAGLVAGSGVLSGGKYMGIAPNARLIGLKVLDSQGQGYASNVISAIEFAIANKAALGIDVLNLSLGHPILEPAATDPLVLAVQQAVAAGLVVVASAGNHGLNQITGEVGYAGVTSPGNAPAALTVGSLRTHATVDRSDDEVSPFSSRGPTWYDGLVKPDVLAPGQALVAIGVPTSTLYQNDLLHADVAPYIRLSGTSMAAAVATGVVALVIEANRLDEGPASVLTPNAIKAILEYTAIAVPNATPSDIPSALAQGAGALNGAGALELARAIDPAAAIDTPWIEYGVSPFTLIGDSSHTWSEHVVWGDHVIWGESILWNELAWAEHVIWGASTDADGHAVWGDSVTPDTTSIITDGGTAWSDRVVWGGTLVNALDDGHVIWGELDDQHVIWGDSDDEHVVWGDSLR